MLITKSCTAWRGCCPAVSCSSMLAFFAHPTLCATAHTVGYTHTHIFALVPTIQQITFNIKLQWEKNGISSHVDLECRSSVPPKQHLLCTVFAFCCVMGVQCNALNHTPVPKRLQQRSLGLHFNLNNHSCMCDSMIQS